ncbi:MAG TPA: T9SS type A sorting domain-containing protein [Lentimicrobium sp.]|nr:T9SS type A sorting domain-containing protein [Lentimicrobium sp.]
MKHIYLALIGLFFINFISAQNYRLFNPDTKKVFTDVSGGVNTFGISFDTVIYGDATTMFIPFMNVEGYEVEMDSACISEGSATYCFPETKPIWVGSQVYVNYSNELYTFQTLNGATLEINTALQPGEDHILYQDSGQRFTLNAIENNYESILGIYDSVKNLQIVHTDLQGNSIDSPLNNFIIKTGKELGLINFIRIDSFPQVLTPLSLSGNTGPDAGLTQITNSDLYDYQPGDRLQYSEISFKSSCHIELLYHKFTNLTFLERYDTSDSIIFICDREYFHKDSSKVYFDTIRLAYDRNAVIAQIPFEYVSHEESLSTKTLTLGDYCGTPLWTFTKNTLSMDYCSATDCWKLTDPFNVPPVELETSVVGIGRYYYNSIIPTSLESLNYTFQVNYVEKQGFTCGKEQVVGTTTLELSANQLLIIPNPASDLIQLKGVNHALVEIVDLNGRTVKRIPDYVEGTPIYVTDLVKDLYLVKVLGEGSVMTGKVIVNK